MTRRHCPYCHGYANEGAAAHDPDCPALVPTRRPSHRAVRTCRRCELRYEAGTYSAHCRRYHAKVAR